MRLVIVSCLFFLCACSAAKTPTIDSPDLLVKSDSATWQANGAGELRLREQCILPNERKKIEVTYTPKDAGSDEPSGLWTAIGLVLGFVLKIVLN
jgi:hypothetical protein